jgi:hypothetical protein
VAAVHHPGRRTLARTESRWGLYYQRLDRAERDDEGWLRHLNLRKRPGDGAMEFLTRPVAPYLVPVPGFEPDPDASVDILGEVHPLDVATAGRSGQTPSARHAAAPGRPQPFQPAESVADGADQERLRALLRLNEPDVEALLPFTTDADPVVRRTALELLTESSDAAAGPLLTAALGDENADVRVTAAAGLREVVELLGDSAEVDHGLHAARASEDPVVRAAALDLLRALRRTAPEVFARHLDDPDPAVRRQAVRGLVSLDALAGLTPVVSDPTPMSASPSPPA